MSEGYEKIEDVDIEDLGFKEALQRLESINKRLERNKVPLEKAIDLYQHGMSLIEHCEKKLEEAEGKIKKITEEDEEEDFEIDIDDR